MAYGSYKRVCVYIGGTYGRYGPDEEVRKKKKISSTANGFCDTQIDASLHWQSSHLVPGSIPGVNLRDGTSTLNTPF